MPKIPANPAHVREAVFSQCRNYRYWLSIDRGTGDGTVAGCFLNPSVADRDYNDPTIERFQRRAFERGIGGRTFRRLVVVNIFALCSTDPIELYENDDPTGSQNNWHIMKAANEADLFVCGWGEHGAHQHRGHDVKRRLSEFGFALHAFRVNQSGHPAHPLYLPYRLQPKPWS